MKITPKILDIQVKAYKKNKEESFKESICQAYLISRWVWQKKVDIKKILDTKENKKKMTDDEMLVKVKALNNIFGGEVIVSGKK